MSLSTSPEPGRPDRSRLVIQVLLVLVVVLGVALVVELATDRSTPQTTPSATTPASSATTSAPEGSTSASQTSQPQVARNLADDPMAVGQADAPLVIVEWTDFRCPYCAVFANQTLPTLLADYVESGKVRYEFHDAAFFGDQSVDAAVAARAAGQQGRYLEYLQALYAAAPESGHPDLPRDTLIGFARAAGVDDLEAFEAALDDQALRAEVQQETTRAQQLGVTGVPFFLIGDQAFSGAQPIEVFRQVIEEQLAKAPQ